MDCLRQRSSYSGSPARSPGSRSDKKKEAASLLDQWECIFLSCEDRLARSPESAKRFREHLLAQLSCPGRHTITSLLSTNGKQHQDWSSDYYLYAQKRIDPTALFNQVRKEVDLLRDCSKPLVVAIDDTILRKTGKQIPGAAWRKDPLGPPFNLNLVWAQRMIQFSAAVPGRQGEARMIPIIFKDASTPRKPRKSDSPQTWEVYREELKQRNLNRRATDLLHTLQQQRENAPLHVLVDGSFTNRKVLKNLPNQTTLIGRIRKDARLNYLPEEQAPKGRKRVYGPDAPTPERLRKDEEVLWEKVRAFAAGKWWDFKVKTIAPLRWRAAGKDHNLRLVVIAPLGYRKNKQGRLLYRKPAYLICTDTELSLETILQEYVWRWDIEVNHRDEKTLLGVGQAQVRNENSVELVPASAVAAYAMLHIAAMKAYGWAGKPDVIPAPKWRDPNKKKRSSTQDLLNELRRELWSRAIRPSHLNDFMHHVPQETKSEKCYPKLCDALFYATG